MQLNSGPDKLREFLRQHTTFSVIDTGSDYATSGNVVECSRSGDKVQGVIRDRFDETHTTTLLVTSPRHVSAACSCCSSADMREQWCAHAVALLIRADELDFLESKSGFEESDSTYRVNVRSPADIARILKDASCENEGGPASHFRPSVEIRLDYDDDHLGVQVWFDDVLQTQAVFDGFQQPSARSLDNILLKILDDEGHWDEEQGLWYLNSSRSIETVLGLIEEYESIVSLKNGEPVIISHDLLRAQVDIEWQDTSAELVLYWITPDNQKILKEGELLGTGPYWTVVGKTIYRLSPVAARMSAVFPYNATISLSLGQAGPILEALTSDSSIAGVVNVLNADFQPDTQVETPAVTLELEQRVDPSRTTLDSGPFEITGRLEFEYPVPPESERVVYLPDIEFEQQQTETLKLKGFEYRPDGNSYVIRGDAALDLIYSGKESFPRFWNLHGLDSIFKSVRFATLSLNMSVTGSGENDQIDWFDCQVSLVQNRARVPISTLFKKHTVDTDRWIRLDSGAYAQVPGGGLSQLKTTLGLLDPNFRLSNTIKTKLTTAQAIGVGKINDQFMTLELDKRVRELTRRLQNFQSIELIEPTGEFKGELRPYQKEGLSWLSFLGDYELDGILADEMGLGKTVQTLAMLQRIHHPTGKPSRAKPSLIVAPTSVITNWCYEARRFAPNLKVLLLHGPGRKQSFKNIPEYDLIITSFALLRLDRHELERHQFSYLVLDEAQNIKNPSAATTRAAKSLRSERRLALSGTPTENRPLELWSIMDFLMPGYLGSLEFFKSQIEKPILEEGPATEAGKFLAGKTRFFILRRLKKDVEKDLPPKVEAEIPVAMTGSQRSLYMEILAEIRPKLFDEIERRGIRASSISILAALLRLRQVCNHPRSIEAFRDEENYDSGKFNLLQDLVSEALENGQKILLFSQFRDMLSIIRDWLNQEKVSYLYLDGATKNRQDLVDQFNTDEEVRLFLISLKAGGTGLNLTAADTVIIYDPWWNPAVEGQAVDRAHRIGQTKTVNVYRLVTEDSIEQKIMDLKTRKARLVEALVNENGLSTLQLSKEDLESFFTPFPSSD